MGFGLTPLLGDRHGFMPPQLKTNKQDHPIEKYFDNFNNDFSRSSVDGGL